MASFEPVYEGAAYKHTLVTLKGGLAWVEGDTTPTPRVAAPPQVRCRKCERVVPPSYVGASLDLCPAHLNSAFASKEVGYTSDGKLVAISSTLSAALAGKPAFKFERVSVVVDDMSGDDVAEG